MRKFLLHILIVLLVVPLTLPKAPVYGGTLAVDTSLGVIVKLKERTDPYLLTAASGVDLDFVLAHYQENERIEYAEPNGRVQAALAPSDPDYIQQYYLRQVNAEAGWETGTGSAETVVAVLDSGVDLDNPDLRDNIWVNIHERPFDLIDNDGNGKVDDFYGWNFVDDNNDVKPRFESFTELGVNHGTIIAGILGARGNNGVGITGGAWQVKVMPLKVLDSSGYGDSLSVVKAIDYAIDKQVDVINLSVVGHSYSQALQDALQRAWDAGIVIVAATGNEVGSGDDMDVTPAYPVCNDNSGNIIIGVVAVDRNNKLAKFSNYGSTCSDVAAPGVNFFSTVAYNDQFPGFNHHYKGGFSGTSVATPLVSALAALIKSVNPSMTNVQIRNIILNTASNIDAENPNYRGQLGTGLIDYGRALGAAKATLSSVTHPVSQDWLVVGAAAGGGPHVRVFDFQGNALSQFFAYQQSFRGGVNVAAGDVDGDGIKEIITGAGPGGGPHVRVFDAQGHVQSQFFAYEESFRGGVNVAAGDVDGDGVAEIITAPQSGKEGVVKIFDNNGHMRFKFLAYADNFTGGVNVAVRDVDGNGSAEIITGAGSGGGPHVRVFDRSGKLKSQFFAYEESFRGGVNVAAGDVDGDGKMDIVTGAGSGGGPHVRVFSLEGKLKQQFFSFDPESSIGVNVVTGDMTGDGQTEILVGPQRGSAPDVRIFAGSQRLLNTLTVYTKAFRGGVNLTVLER